jgi:predicted acylesterase/phospholipase RssA
MLSEIKSIVSCDGGGIKGTMTARILDRLEKARPGCITGADLYAGTSTGGILAVALAAGLTPSQCGDLYQQNGKAIFASRGALDIFTLHGDEFFRADYEQTGLRKALEAQLGTKKLKDLPKRVLIPALDMRNWRPKFFDSEDDGDLLAVDVALATAAAPTYFPAHGWKSDGAATTTCFADGGLFANNPSDSALAYASSIGTNLSGVRMLSLGTGADAPPTPTAPAPLDWGFKQWIVSSPHYLLSALFDASVDASHFRSREQLGDRYFRIQPKLTEHVDMDDPGKIPDLLVMGDKYPLDEAIAWLDARQAAKA